MTPQTCETCQWCAKNWHDDRFHCNNEFSLDSNRIVDLTKKGKNDDCILWEAKTGNPEQSKLF